MIIILGIAGSGKTTQGKILAERLKCPWISVGQLIRNQEITPEAKQKNLQGELMGDELLFPFLNAEFQRLDAGSHEVILDGFPRLLSQARWLASKIEVGKIKLTGVIHLKISKQTAKDRLLHRGRPDDHEAAITQRFSIYEKSVSSILGLLGSQNHDIHEIDGEGSIEEVAKLISRVFK